MTFFGDLLIIATSNVTQTEPLKITDYDELQNSLDSVRSEIYG